MKKTVVFAAFCVFFCFVFNFFAFSQTVAFVSLENCSKQLNAKVYWDTLSGSGILEKDGHQIQFRTENQIVIFDFNAFELLDAPKNINGTVFFTKTFVNRIEEYFAEAKNKDLQIAKEKAENEKKLSQNLTTKENKSSEEIISTGELFKIGAILIDPGHGGKDTGAVGYYTNSKGKKTEIREKDVVLEIGTELYKKLKKDFPDKRIYLSRSDDSTMSLDERVELANNIPLAEHEAILYVSIHANSNLRKEPSGFEVWYLSPGYRRNIIAEDAADKEILPILNSMLEEEFTTESILIAKFILDGLDAEIGKQSPNRGLKEEEWYVVRNANMPSVLVEVGFVSNPNEAKLLADSNYLRKIVTGMYNGLSSFIAHFERSRGFTSGQWIITKIN